MSRCALAAALLGLMALLGSLAGLSPVFEPSRVSLSYGFLLLTAYAAGDLGARLGLPRVSSYIAVGVLCGPAALGLVDPATAAQMKLIDDLALAVIALMAGAELRLGMLRARLRAIALVCGGLVVLGWAGLAAATAGLAPLLPFLRGAQGLELWAVAALVAVVGVSCSPAATIAVIQETRARGPFTDTVLAVSVAMDAVVVLLFAGAVALAGAAAGPGADLLLVALVPAQLLCSVALGVALGFGLAHYMGRIGRQLPVLLAVLAFLISEASRWLHHAVQARWEVSFHLEPLLVAIAAGFVVENLTAQGDRLNRTLHDLAPPIFVVFFAMAGVTLDLGALARTWAPALGFVALRNALVSGGAFLGAVAAGESRRFAALGGLGLYAQAGISLGLAQELARRFPGWGGEAAAFLVACVALNQMVGPVTLQVALGRMGEAGRGHDHGEEA